MAVSNNVPQAPLVMPNPKILDWDALLARRRKYQEDGKTVVWTNGCFDLLHVGHVYNLQAARNLGDVLVLGLNSDSSVTRLKGPARPIIPQSERAEILAALECVDHVIIFDELTPETSLARLMPDIHCKGADYAPPHGKPIPEAKIVTAYGGRIEFLPLLPSLSTTDLVRRIRELPGE
jgi:D-glycero-beta-D-manno-heptose 1-phosphate adenylyltransferase